MEDKEYQVNKMMNTLIELATDEVEKAKQRGYFGKDFVEAACKVIEMEKKFGESGTGNSGYGRAGYDTRRGYGNYSKGYGHYEDEEYEGTGDYNRGGTGRGERYGRNGERYG